MEYDHCPSGDQYSPGDGDLTNAPREMRIFQMGSDHGPEGDGGPPGEWDLINVPQGSVGSLCKIRTI